MINLLMSFITSAAIAVAFRGPLRAVFASGCTGLIGYSVYAGAQRLGSPQLLAIFLGALAIGTAGELLARTLREPTLLFVIPGLFPLVPGIWVYNGMLSMARGDMQAAGQDLARTMFWAGALAAGLALPPALLRSR